MYFLLLDRYFTKDLTNAILCFLCLKDIDFSMSYNRIYKPTTDEFDLAVPTAPFTKTVWNDRYNHPDIPYGVKLKACEILHRPNYCVLRRIFNQVQLSAHCQCNSGFRAGLIGEFPDMTQRGYIRDHWISDWLPLIYNIVESNSLDRLRLQGIGIVLAAMFPIASEYCTPEVMTQTILSLKSVVLENDKFVKAVWIPGKYYFKKLSLMESWVQPLLDPVPLCETLP